jgi:hypothetical protein
MMLWAALFVAQLIVVVAFTFVIGGITDTKYVPPPSLGLQFTLSIVGIPLAILAHRWKNLRSSGKWIWIPGTVGILCDLAAFGPEIARQEFFSTESVGTALTIVTASCAVYSLMLVMLSKLVKPGSGITPPTAQSL